jgi:hypothetical protein
MQVLVRLDEQTLLRLESGLVGLYGKYVLRDWRGSWVRSAVSVEGAGRELGYSENSLRRSTEVIVGR